MIDRIVTYGLCHAKGNQCNYVSNESKVPSFFSNIINEKTRINKNSIQYR